MESTLLTREIVDAVNNAIRGAIDIQKVDVALNKYDPEKKRLVEGCERTVAALEGRRLELDDDGNAYFLDERMIN